MKKFLSCLFFVTLFLFTSFASKTLCIYPSSDELLKYSNLFLVDAKEDIKTCSLKIDEKLLTSGDQRLMEYISSSAGVDTVLIPIKEKASDFFHLRLFIYDNGKFIKLWESLDKSTSDFPPEVLLTLYPYFKKDKYGLVFFEDLASGTSVLIDKLNKPNINGYVLLKEGTHFFNFSAIGYNTKECAYIIEKDVINTINIDLENPKFNNIVVSSEPISDVYLDGVNIGKTPLTIEEYTIPLVLRFKSEGFSDRVISIDKPCDNYNVILKPLWMADENLFKKTQNKFYRSFARTLLLVGGYAATNGTGIIENKSTRNIVNYGIYGLIGASLVDFGIDLYKYFKNTEKIAP